MFNNKKNPLSNLLGGKKDSDTPTKETSGEGKSLLGLGALQNNSNSGGSSLFASEVSIPTGHVDFGLNLSPSPPSTDFPASAPVQDFTLPEEASSMDTPPIADQFSNDQFSNEQFTSEPEPTFAPEPNQFDMPAETASSAPAFEQPVQPASYEVADDFEPNVFDNVAPPTFEEPNASTTPPVFEFEESIGDFNTTKTPSAESTPPSADSFDQFIQQPQQPELNVPASSEFNNPNQGIPSWQEDLDSQGFIDGDIPDEFVKDVPNAAQIEAELEASMRDDVDDFHSPDLDAAFASTGEENATTPTENFSNTASETLNQLEPSPETYTELLNEGNTPSTPAPPDISQFNQNDFLKPVDDNQSEFNHINTTPDHFAPVNPPTYSSSPETVNLDHELATQAGEFLDNVDAFYPEEPLDITQSETAHIAMGSEQTPLHVEQNDLMHTADAFEEASKYLMPETATNPVGFDDIPAQAMPDLPPPPPSSMSNQLPEDPIDDGFAPTTEASTAASNDIFEAAFPKQDDAPTEITSNPTTQSATSFISNDEAVSTDDVLYDNPVGFDEALSFSSSNDQASPASSETPYQVSDALTDTPSPSTAAAPQAAPQFVDPTDPNALAGWDDPIATTMMDDFLPADDALNDPFAHIESIATEAPPISITSIPSTESVDAFSVTDAESAEQPLSTSSVAVSEKPSSTGVNMETLEVLDSINLSNNKKLLLVRNELPGTSPTQAVYALMGQEGNPDNTAEELAISVVKILEPHHLGLVAGQHHSEIGSPKITAVKEGKAGEKDMFITKVGQWQGIISADQGSIILHTEL